METGQKPESKHRLPPIIIVPDKTYVDDEGNVIPTDVILISDFTFYGKMRAVLDAWGKEELGIPGKRGKIIE